MDLIDGFNKTNFEVIMKLNEICSSITVGVNKFNEAQEESGALVKMLLLTGQSLNDKGFIDVNSHTTKSVFIEPELVEKKKLKSGDIIFLSKGTNLRASIVTEEQEHLNLLAPATCLIIKAKLDLVVPEFLTVFLNSDYGQAVLTSLNKGTAILNIPVSALKEIEISVPELVAQEKLAEVFYKNNQVLNAIEQLKAQQIKVTNAAYQKLMSEGE